MKKITTKFEIKIVSISDIVSNDFFFKITTRRNIKYLSESIYYVGLLNYPYLLKIGNFYRIVSGFRRVVACFYLRNKYIMAKILNSYVSLKKCAEIAIAENIFNRKLNTIEFSRIYNLLYKFKKNSRSSLILKNFSNYFPNSKIIKKIDKICLSDIEIQKSVIVGNLSLNTALELKKIKSINNLFFLKLIKKIKITTNLQKKILKFIDEISLRNSMKFIDIFYESFFLKILNSLESDNKVIKKLRFYLKKRRHPNITHIIGDFYNRFIKTKLSKNTSLIIPVFFNKNSYTMTTSFVSLKDLLILKKDIDKLFVFFNFLHNLK